MLIFTNGGIAGVNVGLASCTATFDFGNNLILKINKFVFVKKTPDDEACDSKFDNGLKYKHGCSS